MTFDLGTMNWKTETKIPPVYDTDKYSTYNSGRFVVFRGELYWATKNPFDTSSNIRGCCYLYKKQSSGDWILIDTLKASVAEAPYEWIPFATKHKIYLIRYRSVYSWDETNGFCFLYQYEMQGFIQKVMSYQGGSYCMSSGNGFVFLNRFDETTERWFDHKIQIPSASYQTPYIVNDTLYNVGSRGSDNVIYMAAIPLTKDRNGYFTGYKDAKWHKIGSNYRVDNCVACDNKYIFYDTYRQTFFQYDLTTMKQTERKFSEITCSDSSCIKDIVVYNEKVWMAYQKTILTCDIVNARYEEKEVNVITTSFLGKAILYLLHRIDQIKQNRLTFDASPVKGSKNPVTSNGVLQAFEENKITFDATPTENGKQPVASGGIFAALKEKQENLTFDAIPKQNSQNPVTSDGVLMAIQTAVPNLEAGEGIVITRKENMLLIVLDKNISTPTILLQNITIFATDWSTDMQYQIQSKAITDSNECIIRIYYASDSSKKLMDYRIDYLQNKGTLTIMVDRKPNFNIVIETLEIKTGQEP